MHYSNLRDSMIRYYFPPDAASLGTGWTQLTSSAAVPSTFGSAWPSASFTAHYSNSTLNIELSNPLWAFYGFHCYNVRALCNYFFFPLRKWKAWLLFLFHGGEGSWSTEIKVKPLPLFSNWDSRNQFLIFIFLKYLALYWTWYFQRRAPTVLSPSSLSALQLWSRLWRDGMQPCQMCLEGVCNPQWISCGQDWGAVGAGFTDAERELQAPKVDEMWEHRLVSHINFSLSILSLHGSDFWNVPFTGSLFLAKVFLHFCPSSLPSWTFHAVLALCLYLVSSSSCRTLLALTCSCVVPDSSQGISSCLLAWLQL